MPLGSDVDLSPGHIVLDGPSPPRTGAQQPSPTFAVYGSKPASVLTTVHVYFGQTAGWIRMPLVREVGLGPDVIVLDWDPASPQKGAQQH